MLLTVGFRVNLKPNSRRQGLESVVEADFLSELLNCQRRSIKLVDLGVPVVRVNDVISSGVITLNIVIPFLFYSK